SHALGRLGGRRTRRTRLRRVLGSALGLQLLGMEYTVAAKAAICERLGTVFKGIRWGFGAVVNNWQRLIVFNQHEFNSSSGTPDRARLNIAGYPQTLAIGAVAQPVQFLDSDVIAFAFLNACVRQESQCDQNYAYRTSELQEFRRIARHLFAQPSLLTL